MKLGLLRGLGGWGGGVGVRLIFVMHQFDAPMCCTHVMHSHVMSQVATKAQPMHDGT